MRRVRVLVADDHPVVRAGLVAMLSEHADLDVVAQADDGHGAVAAGRDVDVVLMDLRMPRLDGVAATRLIVDAGGPAVLVLTTFDDDADIARALSAGARGYLLKDTSGADLAAAVRQVAAGGSGLGLAGRERDREFAAGGPSVTPRLTRREAQVLEGVAHGASNAAIGRELFITEETVKTHLRKVFDKLGVGDRTAAVTAAIRIGLLRLEG